MTTQGEAMLSESVARKVLETVDAGLVHGVGNPVLGQMCVEAAVCFALGQEHGDKPKCVGSAVRAYKININDAAWSSDQARAKGMRRVAIAQLGSDKIDQRAFADFVIVEGVKRILPIALRAASSRVASPGKEEIAACIPACEAATDRTTAQAAARAAREICRKHAAYAAAYAADAAAYDAAYAAAADADAAAYADAYAARDKVLSLAAEIGVEALRAQDCEGCQWLWLCDAVTA